MFLDEGFLLCDYVVSHLDAANEFTFGQSLKNGTFFLPLCFHKFHSSFFMGCALCHMFSPIYFLVLDLAVEYVLASTAHELGWFVAEVAILCKV